jgi:hypothetical protein
MRSLGIIVARQRARREPFAKDGDVENNMQGDLALQPFPQGAWQDGLARRPAPAALSFALKEVEPLTERRIVERNRARRLKTATGR